MNWYRIKNFNSLVSNITNFVGEISVNGEGFYYGSEVKGSSYRTEFFNGNWEHCFSLEDIVIGADIFNLSPGDDVFIGLNAAETYEKLTYINLNYSLIMLGFGTTPWKISLGDNSHYSYLYATEISEAHGYDHSVTLKGAVINQSSEILQQATELTGLILRLPKDEDGNIIQGFYDASWSNTSLRLESPFGERYQALFYFSDTGELTLTNLMTLAQE